MEGNGNRMRSYSSKLPQNRYATNARNLTSVLDENEFSYTLEQSQEVRFLVALFHSGCSRGYVAVSTDNLASLNEQQFVDLVF